MTDAGCVSPLSTADIADYWSHDLPREEVDRIDDHVFQCAGCAKRLAEGEALARGIADLVREGRFQSIITEGLLNRLSRDGVRIRTFAIGPGETVPCGVWQDDDLVVARIRADLEGLDAVTLVTRLASGEEISRFADIRVKPGQREIIRATSAALLRRLPAVHVHMTLSSGAGPDQRTIGEYVLEHGGAFTRDAR